MIGTWILTIGAVLLTGSPPAQSTAQPTSATAVISGIVTDDAGTPAATVRVSVFSRSANLARATLTDASGRYEIGGLPAATYTVTASRPGFLPRRFGQTTSRGPGTPITVGPAARFVADIRLPRLGAISGRVVDESGRPVTTTVGAYLWMEMREIRALARAESTTSDRYGRYRFDGLPPGDYLVGAMAIPEDLEQMAPEFVRQAEDAVRNPVLPLPERAEAAGTVSYVTSYYPGVASPRAAALIDVSPGSERGDVDLRLLVLPTTVVQGTVFEGNGEPAASKIVVLVSPDDSTPTGLAGATGLDGRFIIGTVPHGNYLVISGSAATNFVATGDRVTGLTLTLPADVEIAGRVVYAGREEPPIVAGIRPTITINLRPSGPAPIGGVPRPGGYLRADLDGHFVGKVAPGSYIATVGAYQLAPGWIAESVMAGDQNVLDFPVNVRPGQPITNLVVTFVDQATEISGMLRHPDGTPEFGVFMIAFAADSRFWTAESRRVQTVRPDTTGEFRFSGLPPGDYLIAAVTEFDTSGGVDPAVFEALAAVATPLSLARGQKTTIDFAVGGR